MLSPVLDMGMIYRPAQLAVGMNKRLQMRILLSTNDSGTKKIEK